MAVKARPCVRCGAEIPVERIEAIPETRLCVRCSQEVGGDFEVTITPDNLAKAGSLKKNYAGFSVQKKRRQIKPKEE